ncbi:MAG TPA: hypothetical protein VK171_02430 [Fimbriimonas sp.]|nr:hypothetical protein [Fimbriimonas sp.]
MKLFLRYVIAYAVSMAVYALLQYIAVKVTINSEGALTGEAFLGAFFYLTLVHILGFAFDSPIEKLTKRKWLGLAIGYLGATIMLVAINWNSAGPAKIAWSAATVVFVFVITFIVSTGAADAVARRFSDKDSPAVP